MGRTFASNCFSDESRIGPVHFRGLSPCEHDLVYDGTRGITNIRYDNNNNPIRIQFDNGSVTKYVYSVTGQKLRTIHYTAPKNIHVEMGCDYEDIESNYLTKDSVDYFLGGNVIYENNQFSKILFDGGYIDSYTEMESLPVRPIREFAATDGDYQIQLEEFVRAQKTKVLGFKFYNKDHLGNNREVIDQDGNICQKTDYYPFGTPYFSRYVTINEADQPFKYNGKEFDMMHGLNTYDYGARQYNPILPMWDRVDPLAEKYCNISPYAYCANNPVKYVDPDGKDVWLFATKLPGIHVPFATHTFLVVTGDDGKVLRYAAYGPQKGNPIGGDKLVECHYLQDQQVYTDFFDGKVNDNLKGLPQKVNVPMGMKSRDFDNKVIQTINSFGNKDGISYTIFGGGSDKTSGNCNTSSSTVLIKSGVGEEEMKSLESNIEGINTGFQTTTPKPWTKGEQEKALREKESIERSNSLKAL